MEPEPLDPERFTLLQHNEKQLHPNALAARKLLLEKNPKVLGGPGDWFAGVEEELHKYVPYNGGLGETQRAWFRSQLREALEEKQYVLVFSHVQMYTELATRKKTLLWDSEEVGDFS